MSSGPEHNLQTESPERVRSLREDEVLREGVILGRGVAIQCQFCPGQAFRRSRLRAADWTEVAQMRYPVRCLRCSQRQMVSFTVAGISVPSHVKQRKAQHAHADAKHWPQPVKESLRPQRVRRAGVEQAASATTEQQEKRTS